MENKNFKSEEVYQEWCRQMVGGIHMSTITMNEERIKEIIEEIRVKMHVPEGNTLY